MKEFLIRHLIYIIILINTLIGQFIDFESNVDLRQIRESDRLYFQNTSNDINDFFNINIFGTDIEDLEIEATLHLIIESITTVFVEQLLASPGSAYPHSNGHLNGHLNSSLNGI